MNNNENSDFSSKLPTESLTSSKELSDDMEMVSPGVMLREAREKLGLSTKDIANRLNFKVSLVENIEQDSLDPRLPETFNRGYLSSYAKIVAVEIEDVLVSYDALGVAQTQRSELQSFSNLTIKEAEHSRVMWLSYLIIAILVGLTVLWWMQEESQQAASIENSSAIKKESGNTSQRLTLVSNPDNGQESSDVIVSTPKLVLTPKKQSDSQVNNHQGKVEFIAVEDSILTGTEPLAEMKEQPLLAGVTSPKVNQKSDGSTTKETSDNDFSVNAQPLDNYAAHAVFTFSGDCWVNIYDATGERVAWGVKKSGYVMTVKGKAPLRVTLGKPELASIIYNEQAVDMSSFNVGNIAKFTLPLSVNKEG